MELRSLGQIAAACGGELLHGSPSVLVPRLCTDTRHLLADDLFVALEGEHFDGHAFLKETSRRGASGVLARRSKIPADWDGCPIIAVEETRVALGRIAAAYRAAFQPAIIAVGGSNGKTTTKELLASVLRQNFQTLWSQASFNNDIGVPLTLLNLERRHQVAVLELGTNHPGELAPLVRMVQPRFGIITSIGREHLEFFGDLTGVAEEEGWLAELLPPHGRLFLNGDSPAVDSISKRTSAPVTRAGFGPGNDWRARGAEVTGMGMVFHVLAPDPRYARAFRIPLIGRHQVINALLCLAVAAEMGMTPEAVQAGFDQCDPPRMRLQLWAQGGVQVIDDSYNANTDSMNAALQTLSEFPCQGRRIAVLGDMAELGVHGLEAHEEVGRSAATLGVRQLFAVGRMASVTARAAREAGLSEVLEFADVEEAAVALKTFVKPRDVVLIKASRSTGLERIGNALKNGNGSHCKGSR
jgi:UDP-N-acetylmuramoyl-tripeptide--D-alanyl-D-alanine ligase